MIQYFKNLDGQTIEITKPENGIWVNLVPPFKEEEFVEQEEIQEQHEEEESLVSVDSENFKVSPFSLVYNDVIQKNKEAIYSLWQSASSEFKKQYSV